MKIGRFFSSVSRRIVPKPPPIIIPKKSPPMLPAPVVEEPPQASSSTAPPLPSKAGQKRRALLIGIQNKPPEALVPFNKPKGKAKGKKLSHQAVAEGSNELKGCHKDVRELKQILIEIYGYLESDIVVLMDGDEPDRLLPTQENILLHMKLLVADAKPGDTFFLHFSGHSTQEPTDSKDEEDGMDEFIVTYDDKLIKDDILRDTLVKPLPVGARLITVFDTCHSASLLDLEHSRCNRVWVPWMNKGRRRSHTKWNSVVRRRAQPPTMSPRFSVARRNLTRVVTQRKAKRGTAGQGVESPLRSTLSTRRVLPERKAKMSPSGGDPKSPISVGSKDRGPLALKTDGNWLQERAEDSPIQRCGSPERMFCEGWCDIVENAHLKYPDVISLSAAKDGERAWEDSQGSSMTQSLVNILRRNPNPTYEELLLTVSHDLHQIYLGIHAKSRDYKKKVRIANLARLAKGLLMKTPASVEMDNFQNPQVSSLYPLDTKTKRWAP